MALKKIKHIIKRLLYRNPPSLTAEELRKKGGIIGNNFDNYGVIDDAYAFLLVVGDNVTIATNATLLMHDASLKKTLGFSKVGCVTIGDNVFIGANTIILPNVKIGSNVIVGAGSVVSRNIPDNSVAVGNPARIIGSYNDNLDKNTKLLKEKGYYPTFVLKKSRSEKQREYNDLKNGGFGFDR